LVAGPVVSDLVNDQPARGLPWNQSNPDSFHVFLSFVVAGLIAFGVPPLVATWIRRSSPVRHTRRLQLTYDAAAAEDSGYRESHRHHEFLLCEIETPSDTQGVVALLSVRELLLVGKYANEESRVLWKSDEISFEGDSGTTWSAQFSLPPSSIPRASFVHVLEPEREGTSFLVGLCWELSLTIERRSASVEETRLLEFRRSGTNPTRESICDGSEPSS
jgi:hypothetical protein